MGRVMGFLQDTLYPRRLLCLSCGKPSWGERLCPACAAQLEEEGLGDETCRICGYPLTDGKCSFCHGRGRVAIRSARRYTGITRTLVYRLKFDCVGDAAEVLAGLMADAARRLPLPRDTVVTWVTMPTWRRLDRGIDHGRLLAEKTAACLQLPVRQTMLRRKASILAGQKELDRAGRLRNLEGTFSCMENTPRSVLLIDDVTTTGATAYTCAACLSRGGAQEVFVVTAARVILEDKGENRHDTQTIADMLYAGAARLGLHRLWTAGAGRYGKMHPSGWRKNPQNKSHDRSGLHHLLHPEKGRRNRGGKP